MALIWLEMAPSWPEMSLALDWAEKMLCMTFSMPTPVGVMKAAMELPTMPRTPTAAPPTTAANVTGLGACDMNQLPSCGMP